jgi:general secretion pathway protein I
MMADLHRLYRKTKSAFGRIESGFTLLEVMVALAVMAIVLVSVYKMHTQSLTMTTASRFYTQAPILAQSKLAELEALSSNVFPENSGDFGENFPGYSWKSSVGGVASEFLGEVAEDLKRIEITVTYNENEFVYNLRTYRFERQ